MYLVHVRAVCVGSCIHMKVRCETLESEKDLICIESELFNAAGDLNVAFISSHLDNVWQIFTRVL